MKRKTRDSLISKLVREMKYETSHEKRHELYVAVDGILYGWREKSKKRSKSEVSITASINFLRNKNAYNS